jgi:hypothetical protein
VQPDRRRAHQLRQDLCWLDGEACDQLDLLAPFGPTLSWFGRTAHALLLLGAVVSAFLLRSRVRELPRLALAAALVNIVAAATLSWQVWYFFSDGPYQSYWWWTVGLALAVLPLVWLRRIVSLTRSTFPKSTEG